MNIFEVIFERVFIYTTVNINQQSAVQLQAAVKSLSVICFQGLL